MKKKFAGFNPQQKFLLLRKLGYEGAQDVTEMDKFLKASPAAAAKLGAWSKQAEDKVNKNPNLNFNQGGLSPEQAKQNLDAAQANYAANQSSANEAAVKTAQTAQQTVGVPSAGEALQTAIEDPKSVMTPANVEKIVEEDNQVIAEGTGQQEEVEEKPVTTVTDTATATAAPKTDAAQVDPTKVSDDVTATLDGMEAAKAEPSEKATVRGQLAMLMEDFEGEGTPPWASGAMRKAMAVMQQRGMGASSMAGMAVVQAAMESAIGIASQDASTQAQFEMQNLNNEQQTRIFKTQQRIAGLFTDQAADNAAKQFNAASKNQTDQFFAELQTTVSRFNTEQINSIRQFNAGETNTSDRFYSQLQAQRDQFNAQNDLVIAQANAQWRQTIATTNTAAQNEANRQAALAANGLTQRAMDQIWQRERDLMNFAFASSESAQDRNLSLLLADKNIAQANREIDASESNAKKSALGYIAGSLLGGFF